ncbi:phosphate ABC transporter permease subunit PstC [Candidatus Formimonas warabiya]|nr:phosphate ABC transporter permease subunit PstC [Candidatus Formimonas warabiya]
MERPEAGAPYFVLNKSRIRFLKRKDFFFEKSVQALAVVSALIIVFIFIFVGLKAWDVLKISGISFVTERGFDRQIIDAFNAPVEAQVWQFGAWGLLIGTITTTLGALFIAVPMGIGTAVVIAELSPSWVKNMLQLVVRLLASIPSIIYGLIGLLIIVPYIQKLFITGDLQIQYIDYFQLTGNSMLAGILVLSIMIVPFIIALSVDAINAVPRRYKEASLALGLSHWRTIVRVILPAAKSGILAGIILATGRAVGEAIALSMVSGGIGNVPQLSHGPVFFLTPVLTLASAIVNKSEMMSVPSIQAALFACGVILLLTTTLLSLCAKLVEFFVKRSEGID